MKIKILIILVFFSTRLFGQFEFESMDFYTNLSKSEQDTNSHKIGILSYIHNDFGEDNTTFFNDNIISYRYKLKKWEFGIKNRFFISTSCSNLSIVNSNGHVSVILNEDRLMENYIIPSFLVIKKFSNKTGNFNFYFGIEIGKKYFSKYYKHLIINNITCKYYWNLNIKNFEFENFSKISDIQSPQILIDDFSKLKYSSPGEEYESSIQRISYTFREDNNHVSKFYTNFSIFNFWGNSKIIGFGNRTKYHNLCLDFEYNIIKDEMFDIAKTTNYNFCFGYNFKKISSNIGFNLKQKQQLPLFYNNLFYPNKKYGFIFYLDLNFVI